MAPLQVVLQVAKLQALLAFLQTHLASLLGYLDALPLLLVNQFVLSLHDLPVKGFRLFDTDGVEENCDLPALLGPIHRHPMPTPLLFDLDRLMQVVDLGLARGLLHRFIPLHLQVFHNGYLVSQSPSLMNSRLHLVVFS